MSFKQWAIRIILGVVLGFGAGAVVYALMWGFLTLVFGGLDEYLRREHRREEAWLHILGFSVLLGAASATMIASFLAVMLAPTGCSDRFVMRSWLMAAGSALIVGGLFGGAVSLLNPEVAAMNRSFLLALATGVLTGIGAATMLRLSINR